MFDPDSVTICEEPFADVWRDSKAIREEHIEEIGAREGVPLDVNNDLFERLDSVGALLSMTARSNGRMFGYLLTIIGPSLENPLHVVGTQTAFFVSKHMRGLGPKLQRASMEALKARGVGELILRAGTRGPSTKLGVLYRRIGATEYGQMYSLMLGDV